jgi:hypothetical protein
MVKICENSKLRIPTVNVFVEKGITPNIIPLDPASAQFTSDAYPIDYSPYVLAFIISSDVGYFDDFSATFTTKSGVAPEAVFIPHNIVTNPQGSGMNNYLMYLVQNGVCANGQKETASFNYGVTFNKYETSIVEGLPKTAIVRAYANTGSIDNEPGN